MGRFTILLALLSACATKSSSPSDPAACQSCADITTHGWCVASGSCVGIHDSCDYGLLTTDNACEQPQLYEKTALPLDCRKPDASDPRCGDQNDTPPKTVGTGPMDNEYAFGGGFIDTANHRLVIAFACDICTAKDSGVMGVDLDTGDRTLLSGQIQDTITGKQTKGTGDQIASLDDVQLAPNGKWWALDSNQNGAQIFEIDPATGNRTILYDQTLFDQDGGICTIGGEGLFVGGGASAASFTSGLGNMIVHPDSKIYMRAERAFGTDQAELDLETIVELSNQTCRVVTAYSTKRSDISVGNGPIIKEQYGWLAEREGALIAGQSNYYMHSIDIATGDRTMISSADPGAMLGMGEQFGSAATAISPDNTTIVTMGKGNTSAFGGTINIDVATGDRTVLAPAGGPQKNADDGVPIPYPDMDGIYVMPSLGSIQLYEPASGNSMFLSR